MYQLVGLGLLALIGYGGYEFALYFSLTVQVIVGLLFVIYFHSDSYEEMHIFQIIPVVIVVSFTIGAVYGDYKRFFPNGLSAGYVREPEPAPKFEPKPDYQHEYTRRYQETDPEPSKPVVDIDKVTDWLQSKPFEKN